MEQIVVAHADVNQMARGDALRIVVVVFSAWRGRSNISRSERIRGARRASCPWQERVLTRSCQRVRRNQRAVSG